MLSLSGTPVTDASLKYVAQLRSLTQVNLNATRVTQAGVKELQAALPKTQIHW